MQKPHSYISVLRQKNSKISFQTENKYVKTTDTLHITINEMQDTYNIELSDYTRNYILENSLETKSYDLDVINFYKDICSMYTLTVDSIMDKLNLKTESYTRNIFNNLAQNL